MLFDRNAILRKDLCVAVIGYESEPKLFVCMLVKIFRIMFDWLFPTDGKKDSINEYNRGKKHLWMRTFCTSMIEKMQEIITELDSKSLKDFV